MKQLHAIALCALALSTGSAHAATSWSLGDSYSSTVGECSRGTTQDGLRINQTGSDMARLANGNACRIQGKDATTGAPTPAAGDNVMVSAWSTTNQTTAGTLWEDAKLKGWLGSGFGVTNRDSGNGDANEGDSPEHAVDNDQRVDGVLYTFTQNMALQSLRLGWSSTDTDLAVFRFSGTGVPPQLSTTSAGGLITSGWEHVGNYADVGTSASLCLAGKNNNGSCKTNESASSWWLVTAYNSTYAGNQKNTGVLGAGNDYFKLLSVSGDIKVSEPAALALAGLGLVGVLFTRRRKQAAAAV